MRKIIFQMHAYCVGTDHAVLVTFPDEVTTKELDDYAEGEGMEWANSYMPYIGGEDDDYESEEQYYEDCGWWWEEYDPVKHAGLVGDE